MNPGRWNSFVGGAPLVAFAILAAPSPGQTPARPSPAAAPLAITIRGPITPELAPTIGQLVTTFYQVYPRLLDRFENPDRAAPRSITLVVQPELRVPGMSGGATVTLSREWLMRHPDDLGMLTHELTHLVQAYPKYEPGWLTEGIAEISRAAYTPVDRPDWRLPERLEPGQNFDTGYTVSGRFLQWLDQKHPGTVDRLHRQMQAGKFHLGDFSEFTGKSVEQLWSECVEELAKPGLRSERSPDPG